MKEELYFKKIKNTNLIHRSKGDFINALESDFAFYFYYSLTSCALIMYSGIMILNWKLKNEEYTELDDDETQ